MRTFEKSVREVFKNKHLLGISHISSILIQNALMAKSDLAGRLFYALKPPMIILIIFSHSTLKAQTGPAAENSNADSLQSFSGNGKFYQIFPLVHAKVVYSDSILASNKTSRDSFLYKARTFFSDHADAKYDLATEDPGNGVVTYEGKLKKNSFSTKSDVYFSIDLDCTDSSCLINLYEIIFASSKKVDNGSLQYSAGGKSIGIDPGAFISKPDINDNAVYIENIPFDQGEYSKKYCGKLDKKLTEIMQNLKAAMR